MGTHILLIEDDDVVRKITARMLMKAGYDVTCASDGTDGVELLYAVRPGLVITDIIMPEMDGIEVILEVRQNAPSTKIIAMSGGGTFHRMNILTFARKLGADCVLAKPFQSDDLIAAVRKALNCAAGP